MLIFSDVLFYSLTLTAYIRPTNGDNKIGLHVLLDKILLRDVFSQNTIPVKCIIEHV